MQLRRPTAGLVASISAFALAFAVATPLSVHAEDKAAAAVSYFTEPAKGTTLHVIHPQFSYRQDFHKNVGIDLGYDADVVSGATPQLFGSDVVTRATEFSDTRHNGAGAIRFMTDYATLSVGGGYGGEKDYRSATMTLGATTDLFSRNTQLAIGWTHNWDRVCDSSNASNQELIELRALDRSDQCFTEAATVATRDLSINTTQASLTQVVTPWLVLQFGVTGQMLDGFQANPYRQIQLGLRAVQEHLPNERNRLAYFIRSKWALKPIKGSIEASARGYLDSWAVESISAELAWDQYLLRSLSIRARGRMHLQDSALFYRDGNQYAQGGASGSYWTGDRELSALMNVVAGAKVTWHWRAQDNPVMKFIDGFIVSGKADLLFYQSLTKNPEFSPNYGRTKGLLDGILVQLQAGFDF